MKTQIRQEIELSLQLNKSMFGQTFVNLTKDKKRNTLKITDVTFTENYTFEQAKEDIMYISKHIVDVKYKKTKTTLFMIGSCEFVDIEYMSVFVYFNCKISEIKQNDKSK